MPDLLIELFSEEIPARMQARAREVSETLRLHIEDLGKGAEKSAGQAEAIRQTLLETPGVRGLHQLRTRRMAHQALVDTHVQVDSRISVSEGHRIAESARARVLSEHPEVLDVLVHIDPDDEVDPDLYATRLPSRDVLLDELQPLLAGLPPPEKIVLHYLNGKVEVELFLGHAFFENGEALRRAETTLAERLKMHTTVRSISLNCMIAPN